MVNKPLAKTSGGGILWYDFQGVGLTSQYTSLRKKPSGSKPISPSSVVMMIFCNFSSEVSKCSWGLVGSVHKGHLHPWSLRWNLKTSPWKRRFLPETIIFRFHVKLGGCIYYQPKVHAIFFSVEGPQKITHIFETACLISSKMGHLMTPVSKLVAPWWNLDPLLYIYIWIYIYHISSWVSLKSYLKN